jgi:hypothetical protein
LFGLRPHPDFHYHINHSGFHHHDDEHHLNVDHHYDDFDVDDHDGAGAR